MEIAKLLVDLIGKTIWPITIFILIFLFRKQIKDRLKYIKEVEFPGGFKAKLSAEKIKALTEETTDELKIIDETESDPYKKDQLKQEIISHQIKRITEQSDNPNEKLNAVEQFVIKDSTMLAFTANHSLSENLEYNIYYDPAFRNHNSPFRYIGLYNEKAIVAVGEVQHIIVCDYENGQLIDKGNGELGLLSKEEYDRIIGIIENAPNYDLEVGHKFFLVDKFNPTRFIKKSYYPIRAKKYFWLDEIDGFKYGMTSEQLAKLLNGKEWE
ncbi:MAG: hypothetical protein JWO03_1059 [Bacteroidetes bacterium]|nr:hypothetical protein [Bacteroidota bacterium]